MPRFLNISKKITQNAIRRLSNDSVDFTHPDIGGWVKIYGNMRQEAGVIAENAVSGTKMDVGLLRAEVKADVALVKADVASLRAEVKADVALVKADITSLKADVNELRKGQVEIHKQIVDVHKQISNSTRVLVATVVGVAGSFFAANRYLDDQKSKEEKAGLSMISVKP